jgi:catechol 2,3-dioxygenase-like lactoylglutathione lyase family enzyme
MSKYYINGIQQIGLGNNDIYATWQWYIDHFNFDLPIFDEEAEAGLMLPYTDGQPRSRHAVLALNYQGGGGLEIWKHTSFEPRPPKHYILPGDLGLYASKIKVKDIASTLELFKAKNLNVLSSIFKGVGGDYFYMKDLNGNVIQVVQGADWHQTKDWHSGGISGAILGVSDIEKSLPFYQEILGYDKILVDETGLSEEFATLDNGTHSFRRVRLTHSKPKSGGFSKLFGNTSIDLIQVKDRKPNTIFEGRMWGELGYIHLCFDVEKMEHLKEACESKGYSFTVDSADSFDMGEAAGRFAYVEDPDGTLIEFVEAHKVPILKKIGWFYDLTKRPEQKPLPSIMLWAMGLMRVKKVI